MLNILISLVAIAIVLIISELAWRQKKIGNELSRKIVHIFVAVFVAFWPYYMDYKQIQLVALAFLTVILISRYFHIFRGITHVKRKTYGDIFFPISIFILAIIAPAHLVFTMALLNIGLADGVAALIGQKLGKKNKYKVFGQTKSIAGTLSFIFVSFAILFISKLINPGEVIGLNLFNFIILPPILSLVENVSVYGADDLTIPLVLLVGLKRF
jgi:phytol kinase